MDVAQAVLRPDLSGSGCYAHARKSLRKRRSEDAALSRETGLRFMPHPSTPCITSRSAVIVKGFCKKLASPLPVKRTSTSC